MKVYFTSCNSPPLLAAEHNVPFLLLLFMTPANSLTSLCPFAPLMRPLLVVPPIAMAAFSNYLSIFLLVMIPICQYIAHLCQSEQKLEIGFNGTGTSNLTEAAARSRVDLG